MTSFRDRPCNEKPEQKRLQCIGDQQDRQHPDKGYGPHGMQCRMTCRYHRPHPGDDCECGEEYGSPVRGKHVLSGSISSGQSVCNEYAEIIAYAEYECGYDDVDYIELHACQSHESDYHHPCDKHRKEAQQGKFEPAVRQPEAEKHDHG